MLECVIYILLQAGTKVVVTKFPLGSVGVEDLMALAKPFGTVVKHLVFPCKVNYTLIKKKKRE